MNKNCEENNNPGCHKSPQNKIIQKYKNYASWVDVISEAVELNADSTGIAFVHDGTEQILTYAELQRGARRVAAALQRGCKKGDRAVLLFQPGLDYVLGLLGCFHAGVVAVPVYPPRNEHHLDRIHLILEAAQASVLMSTESLWLNLQHRPDPHPLLTKAQWLLTDRDCGIGEQLTASDWHPVDLCPDDLAVIQFTSGSTGNPKGVVLQHRQLLANSLVIQKSMGVESSDLSVMWLPTYHDMGLVGAVLQALYTRYPVYLMNPAVFIQRPMRWLELMSRLRATLSVAPNFAYDLCVKRATPSKIQELDLSTWTLAGNGSEPVRAATLRRFAETFGPCGFNARAFLPCYGMAETTLFVAGTPRGQGPDSLRVDKAALDRNEWRSGDTTELVSSGVVGHGMEVAVVNPESLLRCAPGQIGEIWIRGESVAAGYWHQPEATAQTFQARIHAEEGDWLRSGDLGVLHDGKLFVTGRLKDLIIIAGRNLHPHDIEATALAAQSGQRLYQAAAFSVPGDGGETVILAVEIDGARATRPFEDVARALREAVSVEHQLQLAAVVFLRRNELPRTSSGKLRRYLVRQRWLAGELISLSDDSGDTPPPSPTSSAVAAA